MKKSPRFNPPAFNPEKFLANEMKQAHSLPVMPIAFSKERRKAFITVISPKSNITADVQRLLDAVSASLGGRRIHGALWISCVLVALAWLNYTYLVASHPSRPPHVNFVAGMVALPVIALGGWGVFLTRLLVLPRPGGGLLDRVPPALQPGKRSRFLIRAMAFLLLILPWAYLSRR
jgi:hypothetical protein